MRFLSLCFIQGNYYDLSRDTKRGFFMPLIRVWPSNSNATRNEDKPGSCEVNINPKGRRNNK